MCRYCDVLCISFGLRLETSLELIKKQWIYWLSLSILRVTQSLHHQPLLTGLCVLERVVYLVE